MNRIRTWAWRRLPWFHPGMEQLVSWADGAPDPVSEVVTLHLERCTQCRKTAERIRLAMARAAGTDSVRDRTETLREVADCIEVRIAAWASLGESSHRVGMAGERSSASSRGFNLLEVYFGRATADRLESSVCRSASDHHVAPALEPLFNAFLGRRAAAALTRQIVGDAV